MDQTGLGGCRVGAAAECVITSYSIHYTKLYDGDYQGFYGVNVAKVLEIIRLPQVTHLPSAVHPSVRGTFNLRNKVIPLVDLAMWLGKDTPVSENDKVIVTEFNNVVSYNFV